MADHQQIQFDFNFSKSYPFVVSSVEHNRLEEQSAALNEIMMGDFSRAPVKNPTKILDVGCGTGKQTVLLAEKYPGARVIGIDFSPVPDMHGQPANVQYVLGHFEDLVRSHPLLMGESFDLIYQRMLVLGVKDWRAHLTKLKSLLKPGGWLECQEWLPFVCCDAQGTKVSDSWRFKEVVYKWPASQGFEFLVAEKLEGLFKDAGFGGVAAATFPIPYVAGWKDRPETERMGKYVQATQPNFVRKLLGSVVGEDEQDELYREYEAVVTNGEPGLHATFYVVTGQKQ